MKDRILLAFYGDDFTGSTDAMEALDQYGLRTILFLEPPDEKTLARFEDVQCIGVAGTARAKGKSEMKIEIDPVYEKFKEINPYFVHYKVCSTFDSSPEVGSIGYAMDIARNYFTKGTYPLLVAAPALGRYTIFGNHFANFRGTVYRLDEHPVMSKHPVTPMDEANLASHLQKQTQQTIETNTILDMDSESNEVNMLRDSEADITLFDALEEKHMEIFGDTVWESRDNTSRFIVGSSGIEYALGNKWNQEGISKNKEKERKPENLEQMLVVSGSVSDVTKSQLEHAEQSGFHMEQIPFELLTDKEIPEKYMNYILDLLETEQKVVLYTAKGADDPVIDSTKDLFLEHGISKEIGIHIGEQLGKWTKYIMEKADLKRLVIAGGDTSGFITSQLGIFGLEVLQSIAPGAPLCRAYSDNKRFNNLEIALKSGQLGGTDFLENVYKADQR
ncbi:four-carbon acid sugar kinase family protein [Virgibacillus sp. NKC19-3]|uniref:four-carbon acid sugar kinase family protein n=1 Tax=Virgibacillus saliphilus TaxID=2831674 RepID=UPI001C9A5770|nr:four-carbon acid sugar kinase family protein [Virgibacillus sp. NKC19-3]MBY7144480.1 four-carbon acid sugar kinase family protein [Virgibacillus sp. NKC19-3]